MEISNNHNHKIATTIATGCRCSVKKRVSVGFNHLNRTNNYNHIKITCLS